MPNKTITGDAYIVPSRSQTITADGYVVPSTRISIEGDAWVVSSVQEIIQIASDAVVVATEQLPTNVPSPQRPCAAALKQCLPCNDDPISNYSSEDPDPALFCAVATYTQAMPPLGDCGGRGRDLSCTEFCCSEISQADAELCALRKAQECVLGGEP